MDRITAALKDLKDWLASARRLMALFDASAWLMMAPALVGLYFLDPALAKTMLQWMLPSIAAAGVAVILSRLIFPQIHLGELMDEVHGFHSTAAAVVAAALILFVAAVFLGVLYWAKA